MSYVQLGYGSGSGGGGGGGIVAVPQDADASGPGARVWLHNNMADLSTVYTSNEVYPPDTSTDPATADPRVDMSVARAWQFSNATPSGYGVNLPMSFATAEEAVNIDDDVTFYERTVMKFTGLVTAKLKFVVTFRGVSFAQGVAMSLRQIDESTDDNIILQANTDDVRTFGGDSGDVNIDIVDGTNNVRIRQLVMNVPWRNYEAGDLIYAIWDTELSGGSMEHSYCQADYVVH